MASTYSGLKVQLMTTGENAGTWGDITNTNLGTALEEAIAGTTDVTFDSGNVTLTLTDTNTTQPARHLRLNLVGTTGGARDLIVPDFEKSYIVNNTCADAVTVKTAAGTGVAVPAGNSMMLYNDGTNVSTAIDFVPGGTTAETADKWTTPRTFTIGSTGKSVDGSANVSWNLNEIGAQATLVSGTNIKTINGENLLGSGNIDISGGGTGTVTAVTASSPLSSSGGTAPNISLSGIVSVSNGGTGTNFLSSGQYLKGNGSSNITTVSSIPSSDISGLGTMATQSSFSVDINGGSVTGLNELSVTGGSALFNTNNFSGRTVAIGSPASASTWNLYIKGQASPDSGLYVENGSHPNAITSAWRTDYVNTYYLWFSYGAYDNNIGGVTCTSSNSVAYNTSSDYRLKTDVTPMTNSVDRINQLNPIRFKWKNELENPAVDGFLAHEVTPVVPEAITGEKDAVKPDGKIIPQAIDQAKLVPLLVGAVQELSAKVEALEAQLNNT